jgi:hypothetical protein
MLVWNIDDAGWAIVPDEAFTTDSTPTTTTSTNATMNAVKANQSHHSGHEQNVLHGFVVNQTT